MPTATATATADTTELTDFAGAWESRFLAVIKPFLDPCPKLYEGSRFPQESEDSCIAVSVLALNEVAPRMGIFECEVTVDYDYRGTADSATNPRIWGQVLEAVGNGIDGNSPLRNRLSEGRLQVAGGINSITLDSPFQHLHTEKLYTITLRAFLSEQPPL